MFKRLNKKIQIIISFTIITTIIVLAVLAYDSMKDATYKHYGKLVTQHVVQANKNINLYMNLIEETAEYFSSDLGLLSALNSKEFDSRVITTLDGLRSTNLNILGVSLYTSTGLTYTSSNVSNIPSLQWVIKNELPQAFISQSNQNYMWLIRYENLHEFYRTYSNKENGLLSYICKLNDEDGETMGYLLVDTNINILYDFYQNENGNFFQTSACYIITKNGSILTNSNNSIVDLKHTENIQVNNDIYIINQTNNCLTVSSPIPSCDSIIVVDFPLEKLNNKFTLLKTLVIFLSIVFIFLSTVLTFSLANSISEPLDTLYYKMEDFL